MIGVVHEQKTQTVQSRVQSNSSAIRDKRRQNDSPRRGKANAETGAQYELYPAQVNTWKRELLENASELFDKGKSASKAKTDAIAENDELYRQIGKLKVERDFLAERSAQLGLLPEKPW